MIREVTNYSKGSHPDHLYIKLQTNLEDYQRIRKMMERFIPDGFLVVGEPGVKQRVLSDHDIKENPFYQKLARGRHEYFYGIRIFVNPELAKFSVYRKLRSAALIRKLSR
jgi:hypothetical protein